MKNFNKLLLTVLVSVLAIVGVSAQTSGEREVKFYFVQGNDMFYAPWHDNGAELERLYRLIDEYRTDISSRRMHVYVDGYTASSADATRNRNLSFIRSNRVKSEMIVKKGLVEDNFITKNHTVALNGEKDIVVVTLRMPAKEQPAPQPAPAPEPEKVVVIIEEPAPAPPVVVAQPEPAPQPLHVDMKPSKPYCFAVRTNLLYDGFLFPTLGVEWRASRSFGVKLDGTYAFWGSDHGPVQKAWDINPELRWYMGGAKRFYLGLAGNYGEYNLYSYPLDVLLSKEDGYQGNLWNAGLTVGYQVRLSRSFSLDFNLGLGYSQLDYDRFEVIEKERVYRKKDISEHFLGPTQAGINLVWTIGGKK